MWTTPLNENILKYRLNCNRVSFMSGTPDDNPFKYNQSIDNAKKAHEEGFFLESIGIIFSSIATMSELIILMRISEYRDKTFEYFKATEVLFEYNLVDKDLKERLDNFRCFRNKLVHSIALGREKISKQELDEEFEKGTQIHDKIRDVGNDVYVDIVVDS